MKNNTTQQVVATKIAQKISIKQPHIAKVSIKQHKRVALMPVRYALGNDFLMDGRQCKTPRIGGNFKHNPLPANTRTHITLRTLRVGYLYIYDETNFKWSLFKTIQSQYNRFIEIKGKEWHARPFDPSGLLFVNPDERIWLAYSDSKWTTATMKKAQDDPAFRNAHMRLFDPNLKGNQPHACPLVENYNKDGRQKHESRKPDAATYVADIHRATRQEAFWFSRHAFYKKGWFHTRSFTQSIADEHLRGAVIALDDPAGIAMDLGTLMIGRFDQWGMRPAPGFPAPKDGGEPVSYKRAMTTGSAIGALQGIVINQAMSRKRLIKKSKAITEGVASMTSINPWLSFKAWRDYKNIDKNLASEMDTIATEAWGKYKVKFHFDNHEYWMNKTLVNDMAAFDQEWITPLAEAHVAFVKGKEFKNHFKNTYDPKDVHSGLEFAQTVAKCYLGVQDKVPCKKHIEAELDPKSIEESMLVRSLLLNHEDTWKALQAARNQDILSSKPKDELARNKRKELTLGFSTWVYDKFAGALADAETQKSKILAPVVAILGSSIQDLLRRIKPGNAVPAGIEAVAMASGKVLNFVTVEGTIGDQIHASKAMSTALAVPHLSESKVKDIANVDVEYARKNGVDVNAAAKSVTTPMLKDPNESALGLIEPSDAAKELKKLKEVKGATSRFHGLTAIVGTLLTFTAICNLTESVDKAVSAKPGMRWRSWLQLSESVGGIAKGVSEIMLKLSMAGWSGDLSATYMYGFLKNAGAGVGIIAGVGLAVMDICKWKDETAKGNKALAVCYLVSAILNIGAATASFLLLFSFIASATGFLILVAILAIAVNLAISYLKDDSIQEWLNKCCWGHGSPFKTFKEESSELQLALAEA